MEKPNYRLSTKREQGEAKILNGFNFRNRGKSIEEKTFSFLLDCQCQRVDNSESKSYSCDCNTECNCDSECRHCRCVDYKKPCGCDDKCKRDKCRCESVICDGYDSNLDDCIPYESHQCTDSEPSDNCHH